MRKKLEVPSSAPILRCLAVCAVALAVANCAGSPTQRASNRASSKDYGVKASPRVVAEGDPVPKGGGRAMTGKPYVVDGRTYAPHEGRGYDREGWASWYGAAFHGRLTANGEVFDRQSIAAAHPTLPLPSYVRVTNMSNDRSLIVRVNDRGPYERSRLIDLSEAAADALAFKRGGTTRVRVQYVGRASVNGSDDRKLLATLTTDGSPAAILGSEKPVMVAARPEPETAQPTRTPVRLAAAALPPARGPAIRSEPARVRVAEVASHRSPEPTPRRADRPVVAERTPLSAAPSAEPLSILPTSARNEPVGIY